jgi:hypothetical protein
VRRFSESELALIWDRRSEGVGMRTVARELGRGHGSVRTMVESHGGVRPRPRSRSLLHLTLKNGRRSLEGWLLVSRCGRSLGGWAGRLRR